MADPTKTGWLLPLAIAAFLALAMIGSKRNYGVRYLLPMAPLAIVWVSALAEGRGARRWVAMLGLIGQAAAVAAIHPHELSYFNVLAGGKIGGRRVLADSNLDWGQGLRSLARIQADYQPLTLFYFGDTDPVHYGIVADCFLINATDPPKALERTKQNARVYGTTHRFPFAFDYIGDTSGSSDVRNFEAGQFPSTFVAGTRYVAISASLQYGPWGPDAYFRRLDTLKPVAYTDDGTIAIYKVAGRRNHVPWYVGTRLSID